MLHAAVDTKACLAHNIIVTLREHHDLALRHFLHCDSLVTCKRYQSFVTSFFRKLQVFDFHAFFVHKLMKYPPYDSDTVAASAIALIRAANAVLRQFIVMGYVRLLVDGWCLQARFGTSSPCALCRSGRDSMSHLVTCSAVKELRGYIMGAEGHDCIASFFGMNRSRKDPMKYLCFLDILRFTMDSLRASPSPLLPFKLARARRKYLVREHPACRLLLVFDRIH
jgi:hypothetical protein